ncbi:MAG TPA: alpha/beta hydrolase [Polyangiaceae bacterium]|jgi:hypothetical protein
MKKSVGSRLAKVSLGIVAFLALAVGLGRLYAHHEEARITFINDHDTAKTPADFGAPFERVAIPVDSRVLDGVVVRAPEPVAAALLFHGQDETVSNWARAQKYLFDHHVSSMIFDYSAYGRSTGENDVQHLRPDAAAAFKKFATLFPDSPHFIVALSLGVSVSLQAYPDFGPGVQGLVLTGAWTSSQDIAVALGAIPSALSFIVPQTFDNLAAIRRVDAPILLVRASADEIVPAGEPKQLFDAAREPKTLIVAEGYDHNAPWRSVEDKYWAPILDFLRHPKLAATR